MDIRDRFALHPDLSGLLKDWTREVLRYQPDNIVDFSRDYFTALSNTGSVVSSNLQHLRGENAHIGQYALNENNEDIPSYSSPNDTASSVSRRASNISGVNSRPSSSLNLTHTLTSSSSVVPQDGEFSNQESSESIVTVDDLVALLNMPNQHYNTILVKAAANNNMQPHTLAGRMHVLSEILAFNAEEGEERTVDSLFVYALMRQLALSNDTLQGLHSGAPRTGLNLDVTSANELSALAADENDSPSALVQLAHWFTAAPTKITLTEAIQALALAGPGLSVVDFVAQLTQGLRELPLFSEDAKDSDNGEAASLKQAISIAEATLVRLSAELRERGSEETLPASVDDEWVLGFTSDDYTNGSNLSAYANKLMSERREALEEVFKGYAMLCDDNEHAQDNNNLCMPRHDAQLLFNNITSSSLQTHIKQQLEGSADENDSILIPFSIIDDSAKLITVLASFAYNTDFIRYAYEKTHTLSQAEFRYAMNVVKSRFHVVSNMVAPKAKATTSLFLDIDVDMNGVLPVRICKEVSELLFRFYQENYSDQGAMESLYIDYSNQNNSTILFIDQCSDDDSIDLTQFVMYILAKCGHINSTIFDQCLAHTREVLGLE